MKTEIKDRWVEALRSGKYNQGAGYLRDGDNFCCLGVLCDIAMGEGVVTAKPNSPDATVYRYEAVVQADNEWHVSSITNLPDVVVTWAELEGRMNNPAVEIDNEPRSLAGLNDEGRTFAEIADLIEEQL